MQILHNTSGHPKYIDIYYHRTPRCSPSPTPLVLHADFTQGLRAQY